jgi:hypothetical protein
MQGKPSKNAWISLFFFGRIGPFQWVTEEKIKQSAACLTRVAGCERTASALNSFSFL